MINHCFESELYGWPQADSNNLAEKIYKEYANLTVKCWILLDNNNSDVAAAHWQQLLLLGRHAIAFGSCTKQITIQ